MRVVIVAVLVSILVSISTLAEEAPERCIRSLEMPSYPIIARSARVEGLVEVQVEIDATGKVTKAVALHGHPMLVDATLKNVHTWVFQSERGSGKVSKAIMFSYKLAGPEKAFSPCPTVRFQGGSTVEITTNPPTVETTVTDSPPTSPK